MKRFHFFLALALCTLLAGSTFAQQTADAEAGKMASEISEEIYSPFCPGKTLAMCPSPSAAEVRRDIQDMTREGLTKEEIKARVIAEYGEEFRLAEPTSGDNIGLFVALGFGLLLAGLAVFVLTRSRRSDGQDIEGAPSDVEAAPVDDTDVGAPASETVADPEDPYIEQIRREYKG